MKLAEFIMQLNAGHAIIWHVKNGRGVILQEEQNGRRKSGKAMALAILKLLLKPNIVFTDVNLACARLNISALLPPPE